MTEWGAVLLICGFVLFVAVILILLHTFRRVLLRAESVLEKTEAELTQLASETKNLLQHASLSLSLVDQRLQEVEPLCASLKQAGGTIADCMKRVDNVTEAVSTSAMAHVQKARMDNDRLYAEAFRWIDAGLSVWYSWKRQS